MKDLTRREFLRFSTATVTTLGLAACKPIPAPVSVEEATAVIESPTRILFIGDSFSMFLEEHFPKLAASASSPTSVEAGLIWKGGWPLSLHWSIPETIATIQTGNWNTVVLQEDLMDSWLQLDEFFDAIRNFHAEIHKIGAETVLYLPWHYGSRTVPTIEQMAAAHSQIGTELNVKVAPVGLAWQRALQERPELVLLQRDETHSNATGSFLVMCVLYATIFNRSPIGAAYRFAGSNRFDYGWNTPEGWLLPEEDAAFLQQIAEKTVDVSKPCPYNEKDGL